LHMNSDDGKRFIVNAEEKLTAFLELEKTCRRIIPALFSWAEVRLRFFRLLALVQWSA
jgi:hypothetical protein